MTDEHAHPFPWRLTGVVVVIVVIATALAGIALRRNGVEQDTGPPASIFTPAPDLLPVEKQRQVTVLLQVRDNTRKAVSSVLLGVGGDTGFAAELLLPRNLLLPTVPAIQLQDVDGLSGPVSAVEPIGTLLGVQVDLAIEMDRLAWAGLLDSIGEQVDPVVGSRPDAFSLVVTNVLAHLPPDEEAVGQLLTSLGSMARTTNTNEDASHVLVLVGTAIRTLPVKREVLPVTTVRAGTSSVSVVTQPQADAAVGRLFPRALLQPGHKGQTRVVLDRAGASLGAVTSARLRLAGAGFGAVWYSGGAGAEPAATSAVYVPVDTEAARGHGQDVASLLGLPASAVVVDPAPTATVDVRVVLGTDFTPL